MGEQILLWACRTTAAAMAAVIAVIVIAESIHFLT
jgi:hypothetical protein